MNADENRGIAGERSSMDEWSVRRERHVRDLERNLNHLAAQLRAMPEVHKVILFGSYSVGRRDLLTDLDVLVIMDSPLDFVHRCAQLAGRIEVDVALDLLVYTPEEFEVMRSRPFMCQALQTGKVLYERKSPS